MSEAPKNPKIYITRILKHTGLAYLTALTDTAQYQCANCAVAEAERMQVTLKRLVKLLKSKIPAAEKAGTS
ncbi:hypothetical protein JI58_07625 [Marinosulfonomonas sp. PRT-SC04]|nr:hypothetical protein JI58_07625 [Marinosulfonomonas sp. PRT-SC04]